jgi:arylsulfatase A-like enzyme
MPPHPACAHPRNPPRRHPFLLLLLLLLPLLALQPTAPASTPRQPNILFLLTDDQRADTIRALGNRHIRTPNLDRLVRQGTAFTQAHILGGTHGAICMPSRAMLLSGRSLFRVREDLRDTPTWPAQLRHAGWKTLLTGKWHNGQPSATAAFAEGRNVFFGGMSDQNRVKVRDFSPATPPGPERITETPSSETFANAAIDFLQSLTPDAPPFCLYVSFTSPHDPRTPPQPFLAPYLRRPPPTPPNFLPKHPFDNGELTVRDEQLLPWPRTPEAVRRELADYYGMISHVDAQIGRILDALRRSGRADNTLVVLAGDNGLAIGSHGLLGKQSLYEHSTRVPLVIKGPGIPRNHRVNDLVALHQLAATICAYAGVPTPDGAEGASLLPLLQPHTPGQPPALPALFTAYRDIQRAIRDDRWKLISYPKQNRVQLFDLHLDPHETQDLSSNPDASPTLARMRDLLDQHRRLAADPLP